MLRIGWRRRRRRKGRKNGRKKCSEEGGSLKDQMGKTGGKKKGGKYGGSSANDEDGEEKDEGNTHCPVLGVADHGVATSGRGARSPSPGGKKGQQAQTQAQAAVSSKEKTPIDHGVKAVGKDASSGLTIMSKASKK